MKISEIVPERAWPDCRAFGRLPENVVSISKDTESKDGRPRSYITLNVDVVKNDPNAEMYFGLLKFLSKHYKSSISLLFIQCVGKMLAFGPKMFQPTDEQFESMCHVDLDIPISEYRQPYPVVIVEVPDESRIRLAKKYNLKANLCPRWCVVYLRKTDEGVNFIFTMTSFKPVSGNDKYEISHTFQDRPEFASLEQAITIHVPSGEGLDNFNENLYSEDVVRASMNLMLMLVHYGHRVVGPLEPAIYRRNRNKKAFRHLRHGDIETIEIAQNVVVRRHAHSDSDSEPTGMEMAPHWRRGHWRHQSYGPGHQQRKFIFISPVFVRADRAVGDLGNTQASYTLDTKK